MTVYVVIIEDCHTDVDVRIFSTAERAIAYAKEVARDSASRPEDVKEIKSDAWLYAAQYSVESDYVTVVDRTIDEVGA